MSTAATQQKKSYTYQEYRELTDRLLSESKTTGANHSRAMIDYTKMNVTRMNRLDKTVQIEPDLAEVLKNLTVPQKWTVLTEAWCGDAAQIVPVFEKMAELSDNISLEVLLRDEHPDLMNRYLTNGGKAIPKLIATRTDNGEELFNWGPRPEEAQELFWKLKNAGTDFAELSKQLHTWYAKDKTKSVQEELKDKLTNN